MDNLKVTESFADYKEDEDLPRYFGKLLLWIERSIFERISRRVNWLLARVIDGGIEIIQSGGSAGDDGNWRIIIVGNNLRFQRKESGVWQDDKGGVTP